MKYQELLKEQEIWGEKLNEANVHRRENDAIKYWKDIAQKAELEAADVKEKMKKHNFTVK